MRRRLTVGLVPCGLSVTCVWGLVRAGSFTGRSDWRRLLPVTADDLTATVLALIACGALLALLLQPGTGGDRGDMVVGGADRAVRRGGYLSFSRTCSSQRRASRSSSQLTMSAVGTSFSRQVDG